MKIISLWSVGVWLTICSFSMAYSQDAPKPSGGGQTKTSGSGPQATSPAGSDSGALAKELTNPISSNISVPLQSNFDYNLGPNHDGFRYTLNIQPVIPVSLTPKLNLVSRTILPIVHQTSTAVEGDQQTGLGDTVQSVFLSPAKVKPFVYGIGTAVQIPTGTNNLLGTRKLSIGPTGVIFKPVGNFTFVVLAFQVWSVAGSDAHHRVSQTFFEPVVNYTTPKGLGFSLYTESTYDWRTGELSSPIMAMVSQLTTVGKQKVSFQAGLRCWGSSIPLGPSDCGFRLNAILLYPKTLQQVSMQQRSGCYLKATCLKADSLFEERTT